MFIRKGVWVGIQCHLSDHGQISPTVSYDTGVGQKPVKASCENQLAVRSIVYFFFCKLCGTHSLYQYNL